MIAGGDDRKGMTAEGDGHSAEMAVQEIIHAERMLFGGAATMPPSVVTLAPEKLTALAGRWVLRKGGAITIAVDGRALAARTDR